MRIGELAAASGTTSKALRFYEQRGLLPPAERTSSGYRDYDEQTIGRLDFIRRGRAAGLTLAEVQQILQIRDTGQAPCEHVHTLLATRVADLNRQIVELRTLRTALDVLANAAAESDPATCSSDQICRYL